MVNILVALVLISWHWFADFVMQKGEWAINKSKDNWALIKHTGTYSLLWLPWMLLLLPDKMFTFVLITFITHTITDYFTSRKTSKEYANSNFGTDIPRGFDFFVTIGFDQVLHYTQLFLTYYLLAK